MKRKAASIALVLVLFFVTTLFVLAHNNDYPSTEIAIVDTVAYVETDVCCMDKHLDLPFSLDLLPVLNAMRALSYYEYTRGNSLGIEVIMIGEQSCDDYLFTHETEVCADCIMVNDDFDYDTLLENFIHAMESGEALCDSFTSPHWRRSFRDESLALEAASNMPCGPFTSPQRVDFCRVMQNGSGGGRCVVHEIWRWVICTRCSFRTSYVIEQTSSCGRVWS